MRHRLYTGEEMSSSIFIPLRYVLHHDGDEIIMNRLITTTISVDHYREADGIPVVGQFVVKTQYVIELSDRTLELFPMREGPDDDTPFEGFYFSGFHDSCKEIINVLGMPEGTPIN